MQGIVVTGAFGYLGMALLRRLRGRPAVAVGHPPRAAVELPAGVEAVYGDLLLATVALGRGAGALVHLAGGGGEAACRRDPAPAVRTIAHGTSILTAAARAAGTRRLLFASTIAVYGTFRAHGRPYAEDDPVAPDDLYGSLKAAAEHVFTAHGGGTALRIANIYGAGCGVDLGINGAAERFARAAAAGEQLTVFGDGSQRIDYVHVDDVVDAVLQALDADSLPPAINIGGGAPVSILELAEACVRAGEALGARPRIVYKPAPEGKLWPDRSLSNDLALRVLGWAPRVSLDDGVRGLVAVFRGGKDLRPTRQG